MQANGIGSVVSFFAVFVAAICAECIPVMFCAVAVALVGVAWDFSRGNVTSKRKSRRVTGTHMAAKAQSQNTTPSLYGKRKDLSRCIQKY